MRFVLPLLYLPLCAAAAGTSIDVALRAQSAVAGSYFHLGDIGEVRTDDHALAGQLAELRIGRSPRVGGVLTLKAVDVERAVAALKPELKGRMTFSGARHVVIRRGPVQIMDQKRVRETAAQALRSFLAERSARFEIELVGEPGGSLAVPEGRVELRSRLPSVGAIPARVIVWIDVLVDGVHYESVPVGFAVRAYSAVLVSLTRLPAGRVLKPQDFVTHEEQIAGYAGSPVAPQSDITALRLKRPLAAGDVLTWREVQQAPVVSRDQEVAVRLAMGSIAVEAAAVALQDARVGQIIRVRANGSRETYAARVTGTGTVEALWR